MVLHIAASIYKQRLSAFNMKVTLWPAGSPDHGRITNVWRQLAPAVYRHGLKYGIVAAMKSGPTEARTTISDTTYVRHIRSMAQRRIDVLQHRGYKI